MQEISTPVHSKQPRRIIEAQAVFRIAQVSDLWRGSRPIRAVLVGPSGLELRVEVIHPLPGHDDELLQLHYFRPDLGHDDQVIGVSRARVTWGVRRYFQCPRCTRNCCAVYLPREEQKWACRGCYDLAYESQQRRGRGFRLRRARQELDRIQAQLARPRLRWTTRQRLRARAEVAAERMRAVLGEVRLAAQREVESLPSL